MQMIYVYLLTGFFGDIAPTVRDVSEEIRFVGFVAQYSMTV